MTELTVCGLATAVKIYTDMLLPYLRGYIDSDETLEADSKRIRTNTINELEKCLIEAIGVSKTYDGFGREVKQEEKEQVNWEEIKNNFQKSNPSYSFNQLVNIVKKHDREVEELKRRGK